MDSFRSSYTCAITTVGRVSSVGIATRYRLGGPGIESRGVGGRKIFSATVQTDPEAHPASSTMGTGFPPSLLYNGYRVPGRKTAGA